MIPDIFRHMTKCIWMEGWVDGWVGEEIDGQMDGRVGE